MLADGRTTRNDFTIDLNDDTRVGIEVFSAYIQDEIELYIELRAKELEDEEGFAPEEARRAAGAERPADRRRWLRR